MKLRNVPDEVKRFSLFQKIIISFIALFISFGIFTYVSGPNIISNNASELFTNIKYALIINPANTIQNWIAHLSSLDMVYEENEALRQSIASQDMYKAELDKKTEELKELEELMEFNSESSYIKHYASVVSMDVSTWNKSITLNKGEVDGVQVDMAVVSSKGLIGKVISVSESTSVVKLLNSDSNDMSVAVDVQLEEGYTSGILQYYDNENNTYVVQVYDTNVELEEGMQIITSGKGGIFPSGVLVGEVIEVEDLYTSKGKVVTVKPSVDFNNFDYVAILEVES